jgi:hypothetical protein
MSNLWMGIAPGERMTRVIAMASATETILQARLLKSPCHPRALPTLLEAMALWQGAQVRAALCAVDKDGVSDSSLYRDAFADFGRPPLYTLDWVPAPRRGRRRSRDLESGGAFADLRDVVLEEVGR